MPCLFVNEFQSLTKIGFMPNRCIELLGRVLALAFALCAISFAAPMEPARTTMYILVHGINPNENGLNTWKCPQDLGTGGNTWSRKGLVEYLNEQVLNSGHGSYIQTFQKPAKSPIDLGHELADRKRAPDTYECRTDYPLLRPSFVDGINKVWRVMGDPSIKDWKNSNIFESAISNWFIQELAEADGYKAWVASPSTGTVYPYVYEKRSVGKWDFGVANNSETIKDEAGKRYPSTNKTINYSWKGPDGNYRLSQWIINFESANKRKPTIEELRRDRPDLVPSRFVILAHSMGGLTAREYIQNDYYNGDVDKLILFDSPQEGSGASDHAILTSTTGATTAIDAAGIAAEALAWGVFIYLLPTGGLDIDEIGDNFITESAISTIIASTATAGASFAGSLGLVQNYSLKDGANWYMALDPDIRDDEYQEPIDAAKPVSTDNMGRLKHMNSIGLSTQYPIPAFRIFHHSGLPTIGSPRQLSADWLAIDPGNRLSLQNLQLLMSAIPRSMDLMIMGLYHTTWKDLPPPNSLSYARKTGINWVANGASVLGVNLYEHGTNAVPAWSSIADDVQLFSMKNSDVKRKHYNLDEIIGESVQDEEYLNSATSLDVLGSAAGTMQSIIGKTRLACSAAALLSLPPQQAKQFCNIATVPLMVGNASITAAGVVSAATSMLDNHSHDFAQLESWNRNSPDKLTFHSQITDQYIELTRTDLEDFIYESPYVSIRSVEKEEGGTKKVIPEIFLAASGPATEGPVGIFADWAKDISDEATLLANVPDGANSSSSSSNSSSSVGSSLDSKVAVIYDLNDLEPGKIDLQQSGSTRRLGLKRVSHRYLETSTTVSDLKSAGNPVVRDVARYQIPNLMVTKAIKEFRFQIDDLRPDLLLQVKINTNFKNDFLWERNLQTQKCRYFSRAGGGDWSSSGSDIECPWDDLGEFVWRPGSIWEDGPNTVSVMVVNKVGLSSNQQFSFFWQATKLYAKTSWPRDWSVVSSLDALEGRISDLGYPAVFGSSEFNVFDDKAEKVLGPVSLDGTQSSASGSWDRVWTVKPTNMQGITLADGEYSGKMSFFMNDEFAVGTPKPREYNSIVAFTLDTKTPLLSVDFATSDKANSVGNGVLNGREAGVWAHVVQPENSPDDALWFLRRYIVWTRNGVRDSVEFKKLINVRNKQIGIQWSQLSENDKNRIPDGKITVVSEAIDYATPNNLVFEQIAAMESMSDADFPREWIKLRNGDTWISGIHGVTASKEFVLDSKAPTIVAGSAQFGNELLPELSTSYRPKAPVSVAMSKTPNSLKVNSDNLLKFQIGISEDFAERANSNVAVELEFNSTQAADLKKYSGTVDLQANSSNQMFTFIEPESNRLVDGTYSVKIRLSDEAGNSGAWTTIGGWTVSIDRSPVHIQGVYPQSPYFANAADVLGAKSNVTVDQSADIAQNVSNLECWHGLAGPDKPLAWELSFSNQAQTSGSMDLSYSILGGLSTPQNGRWSTYFGCFDQAGNWASGVGPVNVGARYPYLTYPNDLGEQANSIVSLRKISIRGLAPDPSIQGDENFVRYRLEWSQAGTASWQSSGIDVGVWRRKNGQPANISYLSSNEESDLGVWDRTGLGQGDYQIRLSTTQCTQEPCVWTLGKTESIILGEIDPETEINMPTIDLAVPASPIVPGGSPIQLKAALRGASVSSQWKMRMVITSPKSDGQGTDVAVDKVVGAGTAQKVKVSPYYAASTISESNLKKGINLYQLPNGEWHLQFRPKESNSGKLVVRVKKSEITWISGKNTASIVDISPLSSPQPPIELQEFGELWAPNGLNHEISHDMDGVAFDWVFKASGPFQVDLSQVGEANQLYSMGELGQTQFVSVSGVNLAFPVFTVDPALYRWTVEWDGLNGSGQYPGSGSAQVVVTAVENIEGGRVSTTQASIPIQLSNPQLVSNQTGTGILRAGIPSGSEAVAMGTVGYSFGLAGQSTQVSAKVLDARGGLVATLWTSRQLEAGTNPARYSVSWNGIRDNNTVCDAGTYRIVIVAANGNQLEYPVDLRMPTGYVSAPTYNSQNGTGALLKIAEATDLNDDHIWELEPKADYVLKADLTAKWLPPEDRSMNYQWEVKGTQKPFVYDAERFSLGVRRFRSEFPATVMVMIATHGYDLDRWWEQTGKRTVWKIYAKRVIFKQGTDFSEEMLDPSKGTDIVGYDQGSYYNLAVGVKILPDYAFDDISNKMNAIEGITRHIAEDGSAYIQGYSKGKTLSGMNIFSWTESHFDLFNNANSNPILWGYDYATTTADNIHSSLRNAVDSRCKASQDFDITDPEKSGVCGKKNAEKEVSADLDIFNPHKDMISLTLEPPYENGYSGGDYGCYSCDNKNADTKYGVKVTLKVNEDYWNPSYPLAFGMNNLANRYLRYDHTNEVLYGNDYYFDNDQPGGINNFQSNNYFDGYRWTQSQKYGLLSPFEAQRFVMERTEKNPLLFADEIKGTLVPSIFSTRFFLPSKAGDAKYLAWVGGAYRKCQLLPPFDCSTKNLSFFKNSWDNNSETPSQLSSPAPSPMEFKIAEEISPMSFEVVVGRADAKHSEATNASILFPLSDASYIPKASDLQTGKELCSSIISDIRNKETCVQYYTEANSLHYGLNDWNDSKWEQDFKRSYAGESRFWNPVVQSANMVEQSNILIKPSLVTYSQLQGASIAVLRSNYFSTSAVSDVYSTDVQIGDFSSGKFHISESQLSGKPSEAELPGNSTATLKPQAPWQKSNGGASIELSEMNLSGDPYLQHDIDSNGYLEGTSLGFRSLRSSISAVPFSLQELQVGATKEFSLRQLYKGDGVPTSVISTGEKCATLFCSSAGLWDKNPWVKDLSFSNFGVFQKNMDYSKPHDYFKVEAKLISNDLPNLLVTRISAPKQERAPELITLQGQIPGNNQALELSYLKNGILYPIPFTGNSGSNFEPKSTTDSRPILTWFDINKLQGNTSFFLTYGGSKSTDLVYYRKLDVQIGKTVTPGAQGTSVSSIYQDASVYFPSEIPFPGSQNVTVRTAPASDFNYTTFNSLSPIGPVLEVLPSFDFKAVDPDPANWPRVQMRIPKSALGNTSPLDVRIYKPSHVTNQFIMLESQIRSFLDKNGAEIPGTQCDIDGVSGNCGTPPSEYEYLLISGITSSFSEFMAMSRLKVSLSNESIEVSPLISANSKRTIRFTGDYEFFMDDDSLWNNTGDLTPPQKLNIQSVSTGVASITIAGNPGTYSLFALQMVSGKSLSQAPQVVKLQLLPPEFQCVAPGLTKSSWMGTDNGYLSISSKCNHPGTSRIELLDDGNPIAIWQQKLQDSIHWEARSNYVVPRIMAYSSVLQFYSIDGGALQQAGPMVRTDNSRPVLGAISGNIVDDVPNKWLGLELPMSDLESGILGGKLTVKLGNQIVYDNAIAPQSNWSAATQIDAKYLRSCIGCRVEARVRVEDQGHNWNERVWTSKPLYPLPEEVLVWYPMQEGAGDIVHDLTNNSLHLKMASTSVDKVWMNRTSLYMDNTVPQISSVNSINSAQLEGGSMSLDFWYRPGFGNSTTSPRMLLGWNGTSSWKISMVDRSLRIETSSGTVTIPSAFPASGIKAHMAVVVDGRNVDVFMNGQLIGSQSLSTSWKFIPSGKPLIGGGSNSTGAIGSMSQLRIYTTALSQAQVRYAYLGRDLTENGNEQEPIAARASDLPITGLTFDQSCEVPGQSFVQQVDPIADNGYLKWNVTATPGAYKIALMFRGQQPDPSGVELWINDVNRGVYTLPADGIWNTAILPLDFNLAGTQATIKVRPIKTTALAGIALTADLGADAEDFRWPTSDWLAPTPKLLVKVMYNDNDGKWVQPRYELHNTGSEILTGLRLRYYFRGEPWWDVVSQAFYPGDLKLTEHSAGGNVGYVEVPIPEPMPIGGTVYYGTGPAFGFHRTNNEPWYSPDDPSYQEGARNSYVETDKVAIISGDGTLASKFSCYETGAPLGGKPVVVPEAKDEKLNDSKSSLIRMRIVNKGTIPLSDFEVRYYYKVSTSITPEHMVYHSPQALADRVYEGNGLWYERFRYNGRTLNPTEVTEYGDGLNFELWLPNWQSGWSASDDPSHIGLTTNWTEAHGVVILDSHGNIVYGTLPSGAHQEVPASSDVPTDDTDPVASPLAQVRVVARELQPNNPNIFELNAYLENTGNSPIEGFVLKYCFVEDESDKKVEIEPWYLQYASLTTELWGSGKCAVIDYGSTILNPGSKSDWSNGFQLGFHHEGYNIPWIRNDDASFVGIGTIFMEAPHILVYDKLGRKLWGELPKEPISNQALNHPNLLELQGKTLLITVPYAGIFNLEIVNAAGFLVQTIGTETWNAGVAEVDLSSYPLDAGNYIVLRYGSIVLDRIIIE